jgi:phosphomannomutase
MVVELIFSALLKEEGMALKFGTSGVRGLVTEMTDQACYFYARAFGQYLKARSSSTTVSLAGDLRSSTPRIMQAVALALIDEGFNVDHCGFLSTPAVTLHAMAQGQGSIMVTGSHIPDDRNGIKFNLPWGEVLKADEAEISARYRSLVEGNPEAGTGLAAFNRTGELLPTALPELGPANDLARSRYVARYLDFAGEEALSGLRVVLYEHSSVCRDDLAEVLRRLDAEILFVGRSDQFIPVDTEAVQEPDRLAAWVAEQGAQALVSADGDGDRPLVVDELGQVIRGDVLGILVAQYVQAQAVAVPVSCNTALEKSGSFPLVTRTRIGSPYVIEAMQAACEGGHAPVVGYEANGGFLTATELPSPSPRAATGTSLPALPTRDALLPIVSLLLMSKQRQQPLSALVQSLPARFTWSGLLRQVPTDKGRALIERFRQGGPSEAEAAFGQTFGPIKELDLTDGARMIFASDEVVHLRPSGNAPEFRCYTESSSETRARHRNEQTLALLPALF